VTDSHKPPPKKHGHPHGHAAHGTPKKDPHAPHEAHAAEAAHKAAPTRPARDKRPLWLSLAALLVLSYGVYRSRHKPLPDILVQPDHPGFHHDQFVRWTVTLGPGGLPSSVKERPLWAWVEKDGVPVKTVGGIERVKLSRRRREDAWTGRWPVPWNAPLGEYVVRLDTTSWSGVAPSTATARWSVRSVPFQILARPFKTLPPGYGVLTLESVHPLRNAPAPDGTRKDTTVLADWAEFIGADAVVVQGAESGGYDRKLPADDPWIRQSPKVLRAVGDECRKRGVQFGVYVMSFLVGGKPELSPDYEYGWTYENGRLMNGLEKRKRRGVSIADPKRTRDIISVLTRWRDMPEVDFVGLDYIRPVFGGYELASDFARDMPVAVPAGFDKRTARQKMDWLVENRLLGSRRNGPFIDLWYWYRAHRSAQVVRAIKAGIGEKKPLWAFTLSWEKGWHHGQDPHMMRDAGIDMDAIMLYEADSAQFSGFVKQWRAYTSRKQLNLVVGDAVDWPLHQRTLNPAGPEDFLRRNLMAATQFHPDGPAAGIFVHDFLRAWRGRTGPYSMREWMLAGGAAITALRRAHGRLGYKLELAVPDAVDDDAASLKLTADSKSGPLKVRLYASSDVALSREEFELSPGSPAAEFRVAWKPDAQSAARGHRAFVAARAVRADRAEKAQIHIIYFQGRRAKAAHAPEPAPGPGETKGGGKEAPAP
jgi:hypothetical protein